MSGRRLSGKRYMNPAESNQAFLMASLLVQSTNNSAPIKTNSNQPKLITYLDIIKKLNTKLK